MWVWTLNWSRITPQLFVGSCPMSMGDIERIRAGTGATALLSVQHDECLRQFAIDYPAFIRYGGELGLVMARSPMRDFDPPDMRRNLPAAVRVLAGLLAGGHRVYVHCTAGLGRGPLTVLGYLAFVEGYAPEEAAECIRSRRFDIAPNWEAFHGCRQDLVEQHRQRVAERAWALYERRRRHRLPGSPEDDWYQAERETIREALAAPACEPESNSASISTPPAVDHAQAVK